MNTGDVKTTARFLVTGGLQRENASTLGEGRRFHTARLLEVDSRSKTAKTLISYRGCTNNYPDELPNILFTSATLDGDRLYLCAETEVFVYKYPELELLQNVSYPFFQNVHHVTLVLGYVAVVSTGLDLVVLLDKETLEPVRFLNTLHKDPWSRFSKSVDYRKVHSTKPHESHPNFVFSIGNEIWATRFNQKDAVSLDDPSKKIEIGVERPHDGHVMGDYVYFTTVNGCVVIANIHTLKVEDVIDLNEIEEDSSPLGWCRGLAVVDGTTYVGFSRLRETASRENVKWLLGLVGGRQSRDTRITSYDLVRRNKIDEFTMPKDATNVIYSILQC